MRRGRRTAICLAATLLVSAPATSPAGELAAEAGGVKARLLGRIQASTAWIKRASGAVLVLAGLYLGYYYIRAGM